MIVFSKIFEICIIIMYLIGTLLFIGGTLSRREKLKIIANRAAITGFALHSLDLIFFLGAGPGQNSLMQGQFYFSLLSWCVLLVFFFVWWRLKQDFLALIASPLALILFTSSLVISTQTLPIPKVLSGLWFSLHIGAIFVSIGLIIMSFGASLGYLYIHNKIKSKSRLPEFSQDLPSLSSFDKFNHLSTLVGFPLYTLGLISGFIWAAFTWKKVFTWDPKEVITLSIWLVYAYLFHQRVILGWKGKKPAKIALWLFFLTLISLVGINFLTSTHHSFKP